jgi:uncharacterized protein (TIGR03083 family)
MRPADLLAATEFLLGALRPLADRDWSVQAGTLDWDVSTTVTHIAAHLTKATTYLASASTMWSPLVISADPRATNDQLLDGVDAAARALAFAAAHVDGSTVGFHAWGMGDASAFLARGANEVLVHGWDVASGLDLEFDPPPELCVPIVRRRFPWVADDVDPWVALLTAEGRTGERRWIPVEVPLGEWDGTAPVDPSPPAIAWRWDPAAERWVPTYLPAHRSDGGGT